MTPSNNNFVQEEFPVEDYAALRRSVSQSEIVIPYKPVEEPAWSKHNSALPPKPARFSRLNKWDHQRSSIESVVKWAVLAAGTASVATPVLMHIPH